MKYYDIIIIGCGSSGLFCGSQIKHQSCLLIDGSKTIGNKLLMSGLGKCNFTNASNIKDFIHYYGENGKRMRSILYKYNNLEVKNYFKEKGMDSIIQEDQRVFPKSLKSKDVVEILYQENKKNKHDFLLGQKVIDFSLTKEGYYHVNTENKDFKCKYLIVATGGCSYPHTGSDGSIFKILRNKDIKITKLKEALTPISIEDFKYATLQGISIKNALIKIKDKQLMGDLLFTHKGFSGPLILNGSRYMNMGDEIELSFVNDYDQASLLKEMKKDIQGNHKSSLKFVCGYFQDLANRLIEELFKEIEIDSNKKAYLLNNKELESLVEKLTKNRMKIALLGGYNIAMVTNGGVCLDEVMIKSLESKKYPNLYFIGEVLDIDGDTGGFNIQFAFSSGYLVSKDIEAKIATNQG